MIEAVGLIIAGQRAGERQTDGNHIAVHLELERELAPDAECRRHRGSRIVARRGDYHAVETSFHAAVGIGFHLHAICVLEYHIITIWFQHLIIFVNHFDEGCIELSPTRHDDVAGHFLRQDGNGDCRRRTLRDTVFINHLIIHNITAGILTRRDVDRVVHAVEAIEHHAVGCHTW